MDEPPDVPPETLRLVTWPSGGSEEQELRFELDFLGGLTTQARQFRLQTDVRPFVEGVTFEQVWTNRVSGTIGETPAAFASLDDLIAMKLAAGRPKDQEDLRVLLELKRRRGG